MNKTYKVIIVDVNNRRHTFTTDANGADKISDAAEQFPDMTHIRYRLMHFNPANIVSVNIKKTFKTCWIEFMEGKK